MGETLEDRFTGIIAGPEEEIPLTEAALLVASHRYPELDIDYYLETIAGFGAAASARVVANSGVTEKVAVLNHYLFDELGFKPNAAHYHDPRNSLLNDVVERRTGIPITLSLLYMAVGEHLGLDLSGVCFPGHFLVKCELARGTVVLDPFGRGQSLALTDLQRMLRETRGGEVSRAIIAGLLVAATKRQILLRMLRNLKLIYLQEEQFDTALAIMDWIVAADPNQPAEIRDRGMLYQKLECFRAAVSDFEHYLELAPGCSDGDGVRQRLAALQHSVSRLN